MIKKFLIIESLLSYSIWLLLLLWGADFPPPKGFWVLVLLLFLLISCQYYFFLWTWSNMARKSSLLWTLLFFALGGSLTGLILMFPSLSALPLPSIFLGLTFLSLIASLYGLVIWLINRCFYYLLHKRRP